MMLVANAALDQPLYQCFVQPDLCRQLNVLGLTDRVPYQWKICNGDIALYTNHFDLDSYYADSVRNCDFVNNPLIIPAYSLKDVEKCIPGAYSLQLNRGTYYLYTTNFLQRFTADRMPDVFAKYLQHMILEGRTTLRDINMIIAKVAI